MDFAPVCRATVRQVYVAETRPAGRGSFTRQGKVRLRSLDDLDNRTAAARRARDLVADLEADLGGGDRLPIASAHHVTAHH
jgi:hypothetical protein